MPFAILFLFILIIMVNLVNFETKIFFLDFRKVFIFYNFIVKNLYKLRAFKEAF